MHQDADTGAVSSRLLRLPEVANITTLSKAQVYRLIQSNDFPAPVRLSPRRIAWRAIDIEGWCFERRHQEDGGEQ